MKQNQTHTEHLIKLITWLTLFKHIYYVKLNYYFINCKNTEFSVSFIIEKQVLEVDTEEEFSLILWRPCSIPALLTGAHNCLYLQHLGIWLHLSTSIGTCMYVGKHPCTTTHTSTQLHTKYIFSLKIKRRKNLLSAKGKAVIRIYCMKYYFQLIRTLCTFQRAGQTCNFNMNYFLHFLNCCF